MIKELMESHENGTGTIKATFTPLGSDENARELKLEMMNVSSGEVMGLVENLIKLYSEKTHMPPALTLLMITASLKDKGEL